MRIEMGERRGALYPVAAATIVLVALAARRARPHYSSRSRTAGASQRWPKTAG